MPVVTGALIPQIHPRCTAPQDTVAPDVTPAGDPAGVAEELSVGGDCCRYTVQYSRSLAGQPGWIKIWRLTRGKCRGSRTRW